MAKLTALLLIAAVGTASAHEWGIGSCPFVPSQSNFDTDRFLGKWYVIEQIDTSSECLQLLYERISEAQLKVTKVRQHPVLKTVGIDHTNRYSATLDQPSNNEARMRVKWTLNPAKADYVVVDTDYTSFALIFECQKVWPSFHRYSASILSRTDNLGSTKVNELKRIVRDSEVNPEEFQAINHDTCQTVDDPQVDITVDRDTFKDIITTTRNGIQDFSTTIADGFRTFRTTVSDAAATVRAAVTGSPDGTTTQATSGGEVTTTSSSSNTNSQPLPDVNIRTDDREPLDENPVVPSGNPDEIPEEPAADSDVPVDNSGSNPEVSVSNPGVPLSDPEVPLSNPDLTPNNPEIPIGNPDENAIDGVPNIDEPAGSAGEPAGNSQPADEEENVEAVDDVIRTVVQGI